jgi:hypothetical protein
MKVTAIILNFNSYLETVECVKSLLKVKTTNFDLEIVIVDNGSIEKEAIIFKKEFPKLLVIENKINLGFATGNNVGIKLALSRGADFVLLLNNDTVVDKGFLTNLMAIFKKDQRIGIVSPKIYFYPGREYYLRRYKKNELGKVVWYAGGLIDWDNMLPSHRGVDEVDRGQFLELQETDFATGCCMLVRKEVFAKIGYFDDKYFLYWEDIDFCQRARKSGFKILYGPPAFIWHKNASSGGGAGGHISVYYQTRNRILFANKYASLRVKLAILREAITNYLFSSDHWQKKAIKDFFLLRFGPMKN